MLPDVRQALPDTWIAFRGVFSSLTDVPMVGRVSDCGLVHAVFNGLTITPSCVPFTTPSAVSTALTHLDAAFPR